VFSQSHFCFLYLDKFAAKIQQKKEKKVVLAVKVVVLAIKKAGCLPTASFKKQTT